MARVVSRMCVQSGAQSLGDARYLGGLLRGRTFDEDGMITIPSSLEAVGVVRVRSEPAEIK